jgi:hypothetical protein
MISKLFSATRQNTNAMSVVISFLPRLDRGSVEILNPRSWTIVDR